MPSLQAIRRESPGEFTLAVVTAIAVVVLGVEHGILIAVALSLLRHVRHSYRPHTMMLAPGAEGRWQPVPAQPGTQTAPGLIVYRFGADLFYANDHFFVEDVRQLIDRAPSTVGTFIVDASAITDLDYSAARSLTDLFEMLMQQNVTVVFTRVNRYLRSDMAGMALPRSSRRRASSARCRGIGCGGRAGRSANAGRDVAQRRVT